MRGHGHFIDLDARGIPNGISNSRWGGDDRRFPQGFIAITRCGFESFHEFATDIGDIHNSRNFIIQEIIIVNIEVAVNYFSTGKSVVANIYPNPQHTKLTSLKR